MGFSAVFLYQQNHSFMKNNSHVLISKLFAEAQMYINNASQHPEIQKKLNLQGFSSKRFLEGNSLLDECKMLHIQKSQKYGEKQELASQIKAHEQLARQTFEDHVAIVKFAFRKEPATLAKFNIERTARKVEAWTLQASYFYTKAAEHSSLLAQHGLTAEEMAQALAMVEAVTTARNQRLLRKGEAEEATRTRDLSIKALKAWMKDFRTYARLALKDSPQLMEALGMVVPS